MEKPITIARAEFNARLAQAINESGLPAFVIADSLKTVLMQMDELASIQLQRDTEEYNKAQAEQRSDGDGNSETDS